MNLKDYTIYLFKSGPKCSSDGFYGPPLRYEKAKLPNLINNAFYAVNQRATSEIEFKPKVVVTIKAADNQVIIQVQDNGWGIPDTIQGKIFQPFFTTKPTGEGTGLGLSLSYDIVTKGHGGMIEVKTEEGEGTVFIVKLPIQTN